MSILNYIEKIKRENEGPRITAQEPRNMYAGGQLVQNTVDGSRPGYRGDKTQEVLKAYKEYKKSYYSGRQRSPIITFRQFFPIYAKENFADGGSAGQLVRNTADGSRPGYDGRPGGNPLFGKEITGTMLKGRISDVNQSKVNKLIEIITESNNNYKKTITSKDALIKAGWKDGWQNIGTEGNLRKSINKEIGKLNTTYQKIDNYVNNVMLGENALVKDFEAPIKHIQKKFGVSTRVTDKWSSPKHYNSKVYADNKTLFHNLRNKLSMNKFRLLPDGSPRLISDLSEIVSKKLPTVSGQGMFSQSPEIRTILDSAKRNYLQMKAAGLEPKVRFITDPALTPINEWQFIDNETGRLFSTDASIDKVTFEGQTYKNNYLNHVDSRKLYQKEFGNIYTMYDEDLVKYMDTMVMGKDGKPIKLDTFLRREAFDKTGKKSYLNRRMMEFDHADLWDDPFGRKKDGLRLIDRRANQQAGIYKQIYKDKPKLLKSKLDEIGYNKKFKNTDELIKFYSDQAVKPPKFKVPPRGTTELLSFPANLKNLKNVRGTGTLIGGAIELAFYKLDVMNEMSKGKNEAEAKAQALSNSTLGIYKNKEYMKDLKKVAEEKGWDTRAFDKAFTLNNAIQKIDSEKEYYKQKIKSIEEMEGDPEKKAKALTSMKKASAAFDKSSQKMIEKQVEDVAGQVSISKAAETFPTPNLDQIADARYQISDLDFEMPFVGLRESAYEKLLKEKKAAFDVQSKQADPEAGSTFNPITNWFTGTENFFDWRTKGQEKQRLINEMEGRERYLYNLQRGVDPDYPITAQSWENLKAQRPGLGLAGGGRAGYMGGGIAAIRKPNAIPPERQGLRSIMINGKKS